MMADFRSGKPLKIGKNVRPLDIIHPGPLCHLPPPSPRAPGSYPQVINSLSTAFTQARAYLSTDNSQHVNNFKKFCLTLFFKFVKHFKIFFNLTIVKIYARHLQIFKNW